MNIWLAPYQVLLLENVANLCAGRRQADYSFAQFFPLFELGGRIKYLKLLNDWPTRNSKSRFPSTSMSPLGGNKTHCLPWEQSWNALCYIHMSDSSIASTSLVESSWSTLPSVSLLHFTQHIVTTTAITTAIKMPIPIARPSTKLMLFWRSAFLVVPIIEN